MSGIGIDHVSGPEQERSFDVDPGDVANVTGTRRSAARSVDQPAEARDRVAAELLRRPAVRIAVVVPAIMALILGLLDARIVAPELFVALVVAALVMAVGSVVLAAPGSTPPTEQTMRTVRIWQLVSALAGTALLAPFLNVALETDPARFAPVVALALVAQVYSLPRRWCAPICGWTLLIWLLTLVWSGETDPLVLWLHLGGGLLVVATSLVVADKLAATLWAAQVARDDAQQRAALLSSVLRMRSLDPDAVLRGVAEGMSAVGFDVAVIRRVDLFARTATLIADAPRGSHDLRETVPLDMGLFGVAASQGREILVEDLDHDPRAVDHGYGLFVSTVSHELRTPLTVIQGLGQTLSRRWDDLDPPRREDLLGASTRTPNG
jgi:signal transduction histidine kinase